MKAFIHKHYHWIIAVVMFLQAGIYTGLANNGSLFVVPVSEGLEISRSVFSLTSSLRNLCSFALIMFSGVLVKRFGYKKLVLATLPVAALGYFIMSSSQGVLELCMGSVLLGISAGFCGTSSVSRVVNDWFHRHRGTVLGLVSAGSGLGGSACTLGLSAAMDAGSWRSAYLLAAIMAMVLVVLNAVFVKDTPEKMGLKPYGEGELLKKKKRPTIMPQDTFQGYSFKELTRRPVFYLAVVLLIISFVGVYLPYSTVVAHLTDRGLPQEQAVQVQSTMLLALTAAKILLGVLMDVIGVRGTLLICFGCGAMAMWMLTTVTGITGAMVAIMIYAFALPITTITIPLLTIDLFGYHSYVLAMGVFSALVSVGSMLAAPISNAVYDVAGSYNPAFYAGSVVMAGLIVAYLILYRMADRDKATWHGDQQQETQTVK